MLVCLSLLAPSLLRVTQEAKQSSGWGFGQGSLDDASLAREAECFAVRRQNCILEWSPLHTCHKVEKIPVKWFIFLIILFYWRGIIITRSSWLNCALRDDEAVYWVRIGHYEAVAVGNWWYWVSRGHSCLYILQKVEIWTRMPDWLTHRAKIGLLSSLQSIRVELS